MIYPEDRFKLHFWDIFISIMLLITCLTTPMTVAFADELENIQWYNIINLTIDAIFFIDIIITFNTAFYTDEYNIIEDRK